MSEVLNTTSRTVVLKMVTTTMQMCALEQREKISASLRAASVAAASFLPSPIALPVPPLTA